jgi:peptidoglycan/xylan/chitin deacetylase (PgdA/CDA1 family)
MQGVARLSALTGERPRFFRPPYGAQSLASFFAVRRLGMESVVWSDDCDDWTERPESLIAGKAVRAVSPGALLLLHDSLAVDPENPSTLPNLDRKKIVQLIVEGLASRGFRAASLRELLRYGNAHRTVWLRA